MYIHRVRHEPVAHGNGGDCCSIFRAILICQAALDEQFGKAGYIVTILGAKRHRGYVYELAAVAPLYASDGADAPLDGTCSPPRAREPSKSVASCHSLVKIQNT